MNNTNNNKFIILDTGASSHYYPLPQTSVADAATSPVLYSAAKSPVIYSLEFRQAWKTIVDENNNKPKTKNKRKRQRKH